ncbi:MAG: hypothetical protein QM599_07760 [Pseudoxanthomonas sp.]
MNKSPPPPLIDERDWLAQERALSPDARDRRDALLARALRTPSASQPPADFAAETALLAQAHAARAGDDARLERALLKSLLAAMALSALAVAAIYGGRWATWIDRTVDAAAMQWTLAGAACIAMSWLLAGWRRRFAGSGTSATA